MKMIATTALMLITGSCLYAQSGTKALHHKPLIQLSSLQKAMLSMASQMQQSPASFSDVPLATTERVVGVSIYEPAGSTVPIDSTNLTYGNETRKSGYEYLSLLAEEVGYKFGYNFNTEFAVYFPPFLLKQFEMEQFDSMTNYTNYDGSGLKKAITRNAKYNTANKLTNLATNEYNDMGTLSTSEKLIFNYNTAGLIKNIYRIDALLPSGSDTLNIRKFSYNADNKIINDSLFTKTTPGAYELNAYITYEYNADKQLEKFTYYDVIESYNIQIVNTYTSGILSKSILSADGVIQQRNLYEYVTGFNEPVKVTNQSTIDGGTNYDDDLIINFVLNSDNLPDSLKYWYNDGSSFVYGGHATFSYTSLNNPKVVKGYSYDSGTIVHDVTWNYYYETPSGIKNEKVTAPISIYPNPSTGMVYLNWQNVKPQQVEITVLDITGRKIQTHIVNWASEQIALDLSKLPQGNYMIQVQEPSGVNLYSQKVTLR